MEIVMVLLGAIGAWFLVAGPLYQGALELREQEVDREGIDRVSSAIAQPERVSPWWWLLPPVAYVKQRRRSTAYRLAVLEALEPEQIEQSVAFFNKANGWFLVAVGAFLIALKETFEFVELAHWPDWSYWVIVVVVPLLCVGNVAATLARSARMLKREQRGSRGRGPATAAPPR